MDNKSTQADVASVGDGILAQHSAWKFSGSVVKSFDEHVRRSVPLYETAQQIVVKLSDFFVNDHSLIYDIGTSTGEVALQLGHHHRHRTNARIVGIDIEPDMIVQAEAKRCEQNINNVLFKVDDIIQYDFESCDLFVAFYTLQFIRPSMRQLVFERIYSALNWGGAFLLFEKVRGEDARFQDILTSLYNDYKLDQGYSPSEIIGKSQSLKGVLEPFSSQGNRDLLSRAGFSDTTTVFKYLCFEGVLAIK